MKATLTELHQWAAIVLSEGFETAMAGVPGEDECTNALELVSKIADSIVSQGGQIDRDVLRKSVEETLFLSTGPDPMRSRSEFDALFVFFLRKHGISGLLRILLSLHLFNVVWIQTEKSFLKIAGQGQSLQRYTEQVEHTCCRIVRAAWMTPNARSQSSTSPIPPDLIETIEGRLWGSGYSGS